MMRAKVSVTFVEKTDWCEQLSFMPVCDSGFGPEGESEDNTYARYTPAGSIQLTVTNPELYGKFTVGQKFYVDFTSADASTGT